MAQEALDRKCKVIQDVENQVLGFLERKHVPRKATMHGEEELLQKLSQDGCTIIIFTLVS